MRLLTIAGIVLVVLAELVAIPFSSYFGSDPVTVRHKVIGTISSVVIVIGLGTLVAGLVVFLRDHRSPSRVD